jgi:DNA-binding HxlR family transcriptional regulator
MRQCWSYAYSIARTHQKVRTPLDLEKLITGISQKMLAQQLRQLEDDGIVTRTV